MQIHYNTNNAFQAMQIFDEIASFLFNLTPERVGLVYGYDLEKVDDSKRAYLDGKYRLGVAKPLAWWSELDPTNRARLVALAAAVRQFPFGDAAVRQCEVCEERRARVDAKLAAADDALHVLYAITCPGCGRGTDWDPAIFSVTMTWDTMNSEARARIDKENAEEDRAMRYFNDPDAGTAAAETGERMAGWQRVK